MCASLWRFNNRWNISNNIRLSSNLHFRRECLSTAYFNRCNCWVYCFFIDAGCCLACILCDFFTSTAADYFTILQQNAFPMSFSSKYRIYYTVLYLSNTQVILYSGVKVKCNYLVRFATLDCERLDQPLLFFQTELNKIELNWGGKNSWFYWLLIDLQISK